MEAQEQPRPGGRGGGGGGDYFRTMYSRDRDAVASIRRSGLKVGTEFQKWRRRGERKIGRESSGLETDFRVCRADPCVLSCTHERNPSANNSGRFLESPHLARSGTRRKEGLNLPTDNFPLNTAGKNGRPFVTIRPLLFLYLSFSICLSHCLSSILMDSFERVWREESDLKTRDEDFPSSYEILKVYFFAHFEEDDDGSNIFFSLILWL